MLLAFLDHVVALEDQNKMTLNNVAMIMAPNLFYTRGGRRQDLKEAQSDLKMAACTCNVVRMLIRYHNVLWIVREYFSSSTSQIMPSLLTVGRDELEDRHVDINTDRQTDRQTYGLTRKRNGCVNR